MKFVEYILAGGIGGALGAVALSMLNATGDEMLDTLAGGVLGYANDIPVLISALVAGWLGGTFTRSAIGGIVAGLAIPIAFEAWPALLAGF